MAVRALTGMFKSRQSRSASSMHDSMYEGSSHLTEALESAHIQIGVCRSYSMYHQQKLSLWWPISQSISGPVLCP